MVRLWCWFSRDSKHLRYSKKYGNTGIRQNMALSIWRPHPIWPPHPRGWRMPPVCQQDSTSKVYIQQRCIGVSLFTMDPVKSAKNERSVFQLLTDGSLLIWLSSRTIQLERKSPTLPVLCVLKKAHIGIDIETTARASFRIKLRVNNEDINVHKRGQDSTWIPPRTVYVFPCNLGVDPY